MARSCIVTPQTVNKTTGETENSRLYSQIYNFAFNDYNTAKKIYLSTLDNNAINNKKNTKFNEQGEVELQSILENYDVSQFVDNDFENKVRDKFGLTENQPYTRENWEAEEDKCAKLNESLYGNMYVAYPQRTMLGIETKIENRKSKDDKKGISENLSREAQLNKRLREQLQRWGVSIGALNDLEDRISNGVTDFTTAEKTADGLIQLIRLAKGDRGEKALPEEFAHFVIRAMEDNSLVQRTIGLIMKYNLASPILGEQYKDYAERYGNDAYMLAEEAAGKLLKEHLLNSVEIQGEMPYKNLVERTIGAFKKQFGQYDENEIINILNEINDNFRLIANQALDNKTELDASKVRLGGILHEAKEQQKETNTILNNIKNILAVERKKFAILKSSKSSKLEEQTQRLKEIREMLVDYEAEQIIIQLANNTYKELIQTLDELNKLKEENGDWSSKKGYLRTLRNIIYSYKTISDEVNESLASDNDFTEEQKERLTTIANDMNALLAKVMTELKLQSKNAFEEYLRTVFGNSITVDDKVITVEDLVNMNVNDISLWDRWLDSAGESASYLIKAIDHVVKEKKTNARLRTTNIYKQITAMSKMIERSGYKNQEFIFERDENGNQTGWYMSEIDRTKYHKEKKAFEEQLNKKYGEEPKAIDALKKRNELQKWVQEHTEYDEELQAFVPKKSLYHNYQYDRLSEAQKKYLKDFMALKAKMDGYIGVKPENLYSTIKIRKDLLERIKDSSDPKSALGAFTDSIKDAFVYNSKDIDMGIKSAIIDFEGNEVRTLPIFYTSLMSGEKESDVSMDAVSTLTAYAAMALEFDEMSQIIDILELGRDVINDSPGPIKTVGGNPLVETNMNQNTPVRKKNGGRISERLDDYFEANIYHKYQKDEGTIGSSKISVAKTANAANKYSSLKQMGFNALTGISNVATGKVMMRIEAIGGQFFNYKDLLAADKKYAKEIIAFTGEIGARVQTSWLALMNEKFNVLQDYDDEIHNKDYDKKWYNRLFSLDAAFFMMKSGEHYMQTRTFLALIHSKKEALKDRNGKEVLIMDAYTKKDIVAGNPSAGAKIVLKEGLKYKDGKTIVTMEQLEQRAAEHKTEITDKSLLAENEMSEVDFVNKISRKSAYINNQMHGIYNKEDRNAFQRLAVGRLIIMYRKWIKPAVNRRFKKGQYNLDVEDYVEGYYRTTWNFVKQIVKDLTRHQLNYSAIKENMTPTKKANLRKALFEIGTYVMLLIVNAVIFDDDDDDKIEKTWALNMLEYQCRRLQLEIGTMTPTPNMLQEGLKIVDSPMASMNAIQGLTNVFDVLWIPGWADQVERGRYKGIPKPAKSVLEALPFNKSIYRSLNPKEGIPWLKNSMY